MGPRVAKSALLDECMELMSNIPRRRLIAVWRVWGAFILPPEIRRVIFSLRAGKSIPVVTLLHRQGIAPWGTEIANPHSGREMFRCSEKKSWDNV